MTREKENKIKIAPATGRPMLQWVGKKPLDYVKGFPAQLIETFNPTSSVITSGSEALSYDYLKDHWHNLLFHGDNKDVLATLLGNGFRGKIDLIYIDPPFNTGVDYVRKITPRGIKTEKIDGDAYSFAEQIQYSNSWHIDAYLQFLFERLQLAKELMAETGIIFIRMDVHFGYYLRLLADEVFGQDLFENEIIINRIKKNVTDKGRRTIPNAVDYLYIYLKSKNAQFNNVLKKLHKRRPGYWHNMDSPEVSGPHSLTLGGKTYYPSPGTHLKFPQKQAEEMWKNNKIRENPKSGILEYWVEDKDFDNLDTDWTDIPGYSFTTGYPTENSEVLLERVINAGSKPGGIVMDFFHGSGTTTDMAQKLDRRWIGCDINKGAVQTTSKRLQATIKKSLSQLPETKYPCFTVHKVNDYDLQLLRTEAIDLTIQHIGIQRTRTDSFFDGTLGKSLVKVIEFNHPLTLLDLQLLQDELKKRPDEDRDITVVALGKETAIDPWIEEWNKKHPVNKIHLIELKTDKKYGNFLIHKPAEAKIKINRVKDAVSIEIQEFISSTIIERLNIDNKLFKVKIPDFRSMIDVVLIDTDYNGKVFNIKYSDVPEKKADLVKAKYELDITAKKTTIAVKIIDMLGEEVLITKEV